MNPFGTKTGMEELRKQKESTSSWRGYLNDSGFIFPSRPQTIPYYVLLGKAFAHIPKQQGISIFLSTLLSRPAWGDFQNEPRLGTWGPGVLPWLSAVSRGSPLFGRFTAIVLTTWTSFVKAEGVPSKCWLQMRSRKRYRGHGPSLNNLKHISLCLHLVS